MSDAYIVPILSKKEEEQHQQQAKDGYWQNELNSLGIEPKEKKELNDSREELENLSDIIKQGMFQDYKIAYSEEGDIHNEEAKSTVTVG
jgi:DNA repair ATPase RecN